MENEMYVKHVNIVLLGLVMLIPGLMKLFVMGPGAVTGMLESIGFPAAGLFAWILIISEIGSGAAILAKWKLRQVVWLPIIILIVAAITVNINWASLAETSWPGVLLHIAVASNYWLIGSKANR